MNIRNSLAAPQAQTAAVVIVLAIITGLTHYLHIQEFGLYEDDYYFISPAFRWDLNDLINHTQNVFTTWPEGRPVAFSVPEAVTYIGGLKFAYGIGYCVLVLNAWLFYFFAHRVAPPLLAILAAVAFVLFPADTTKPFVSHALQLQVSIAFFLIAAICYLSTNTYLRRLSYLIAFLGLITREEPFLVFVLLPLLDSTWNRRWVRGTAVHIAICLATLLIYGTIRLALGEVRVQSATTSLSLTIAHSLAGMILGPAAALISFPYRFITVFQQLNAEMLWVIGISFGLLLFLLSRFPYNAPANLSSDRVIDTNFFTLRLPAKTVKWLSLYQAKIVLSATLLLSFSYALTFMHYPPTILSGRITSLHLAASIGASLVVGWLCSVIIDLANSKGTRWLALSGIAFFFSILTGFGLIIQQDYVQSWHSQQLQWTQLLPLIPDAEENTIIFVLDNSLPQTRYIQTHTGFTADVLGQLYQFPSEWAVPPRVIFFQNDWGVSLEWTDSGLVWIPNPARPGNKISLQEENVILIRIIDGKWQRQDGVTIIQGRPFRLKPLPPTAMKSLPYNTLPLYHLLILP